MYLIYCLGLLLLVYLTVACALCPRHLLSNHTVVTITFVSIATIIVIQKGVLFALLKGTLSAKR